MDTPSQSVSLLTILLLSQTCCYVSQCERYLRLIPTFVVVAAAVPTVAVVLVTVIVATVGGAVYVAVVAVVVVSAVVVFQLKSLVFNGVFIIKCLDFCEHVV